MSEAQTTVDIYTKALEEKTVILQQCQQDKSLTSCIKCASLIGCNIRNAYVEAVYKNMSKGAQGGFDFN